MASARISPLLLRSLRSAIAPPVRGGLPRPAAARVVPAAAWRIRPARFYSAGQDPAASKPSKIYSFEDISKHVSSPTASRILIDTREPGELQNTGTIPGALNIPITTSPDAFFITPEEFEDRFGFERPAKDAEVVFYCKSGVRSRAAAELAKGAGWTEVAEYPGSWMDWEKRGGKKVGGK